MGGAGVGGGVPGKRYGRTRVRFLSVLSGSLLELFECFVNVSSDRLTVLTLPLKQDHGRQRHAARTRNALEAFLVMTDHIAQDTLDPVTLRGVSTGPPDGYTDLERRFDGAFGNKPVHNPHAAAENGTPFGTLPIKQGLDETSSLEPAIRRKACRVGWRNHTYGTRERPYLPLLVSLTVRFFLPLARRRASTRRPFLVAMRERNPCLLARLRRLG
jgi:hypothetical protein